MYEIRVADRPTNHREFHIVKQAALDRYNRLARHAPHGRLTRGCSAEARETHAGSYTAIIISHAVTMAHAFYSNRYASGFALTRPTLEALLKQALLTAYKGDDSGWQKLVGKKHKVSIRDLKDLASSNGWPDLSQWWVSLTPVLSDFVHGGKGQLLGNPIDEDGWPVYPGDWFWTAMFVATVSVLATSGWFWAHIKDEERAKAVMADLSAEDWGTITTVRSGQTIRIVGSNPESTIDPVHAWPATESPVEIVRGDEG